MPKFVIERDLPGAGNLSAEELRALSVTSNKVIAGLGPEISWLHSYITEDIRCEHARCAGFPVDRVSKIATVIDPATADPVDRRDGGASDD
jgi:hypothetical protein